jgi:hypothetical protein
MNVQGTIPAIPEVIEQQQAAPVKPRVDFKKAAEQQNLAVKTHAVYNNGMKDFDELSSKLKEYGATPAFTAEKLEELELDLDMTVGQALKAIDNYNKDGKKKVAELARTNVRIDAQIKEEKKVQSVVEGYWNSVEPEVSAEEPAKLNFKAIYYTSSTQQKYPKLNISPFIGFFVGYLCTNSFNGGLAGLLTAHVINQLNAA